MQKQGKYEITEDNKKYWVSSDPDNLSDFLWTSKQVAAAFNSMWHDLNKTAGEFGPAPNPLVHDPDTGASVRLLDVAVKGQPLVINFGSCTWPPFMVNLARINKIHDRFASKATFLTVYVQEAHPVEKEEFKNMYFKIKSHQNLKDRLSAANDLREMEELPGPFLVDNMEDEASKLYGAHPERLYIILDGNIVYQGGPGPFDYVPDEVNSWLEKNFG